MNFGEMGRFSSMNPFKISTRIFSLVGTTKENTALVDTLFLHLSGHTRITMTTHRGIHAFTSPPNPKGTRILLIRTHEIRSAITLFHHVLNHTHRRKLVMLITLRMWSLRRSPSIDGFLEKMTRVFWAKEITARILTTEPKRAVFRRRSSRRFTM